MLSHAEAIGRRFGAKLHLGHAILSEAYILMPRDKGEAALRQAREHGEEGMGAR